MMIVPVDPEVYETQDIAQEDPAVTRAARASLALCGAFISRTMMVMIIAMTPSLNASSRFLLMWNFQLTTK